MAAGGVELLPEGRVMYACITRASCAVEAASGRYTIGHNPPIMLWLA